MMERFKLISAVHLFLIRDDKVLLLRRFNTGYEDGNYSVPAGHLDGGEPVTAAAIREAYEECGVSISPADIVVVGVMHRRASEERVDFFLIAAKWVGEIVNAEPHKCDELSWHALDRLPENMVPYVRHALDNYASGVWFSEFGWS